LPASAPITGDLDLSRDDFWARPHERRHAAYARLRAMTAPLFFEAPPSPYGKDEAGYYALVRHADIVSVFHPACDGLITI